MSTSAVHNNGKSVRCRPAVASIIINPPKRLLDAACPLPLGAGGGRRLHDLPDKNFVLRRIAGRSSVNDDVVAGFERESVNTALGQLRDAAPFAAPTSDLAVFIRDFNADERMRISNIEFGDGSFKLDSLIFDITSCKRMMRVGGDAGHRHHQKRQYKQLRLHAVPKETGLSGKIGPKSTVP